MQDLGVKNIFGVVAIDEQRCLAAGCESEAEFAAPRQTPEGVKVVSACARHRNQLEREEGTVSAIAPTCQARPDEPCQKPSTKLIIAGLDRGELRLVSACEPHAEQLLAERRMSIHARETDG